MKIKSIYLPILIFSLLAAGIFIGKLLNYPVEPLAISKNNHKNKLNKLIDFINNEYVDNVNTDSIVDTTVDNILAKLDPHSVYIPKSAQTLEAQSMKGDFVGIGVNFYVYNDSVAIIKPIENGPAEKAGLLSGDRILFADNFRLFGKKITSDSLYAKLKGQENSNVQLTIYRKSNRKTLKFNLKRETIPIKSVDISMLLNPTTGYIKINRFAETTYKEFKTGLTKLQNQGAKSMIIDLRDNGGGFLEIASQIADEFLVDKQLIVFTKNKKGRIDKTFATSKGSFETGKVCVLINENSASASEILAGAIQDNDRGIIVGRRSFGKGLVQREMNFDDGSAVRLTIARYFTPTGRSIQKPYSKGKEEYFKDFDKRFANGELYKKDSIKINDSLKFKTPKGKIVFGGGGIVPDVFVPLQGKHGEESINYIMQSGIISHFIFEELDRNRNQFSGLTFDLMAQNIQKNDLYFNDFQKYLANNGLELDLSKSKILVKKYLVAEFARQLFSEDKYFEIILKEDAMIKTVLETKN